MPRLSSLERGRAIGQLQAGVNNRTWQDGSGDHWRQLKFPSLYRRDITTSGCSLRPEHGTRGIVPGWQLPTPSSQDRGRVPAAGTNHEGGLAGLLTGLKPYWACLGSVGKSSPHTRLNVDSNSTRAVLRRFLLEEWDRLPQNNIQHLIHSMRRRCAECIAAGGDPTHYWCTVAIKLMCSPVWVF